MIAIDDILAKGVALNDHLPVNIYKGNTKVAGWHPQTVSGEGTISLDGAYNVPPDALVIDGKCVQGSTAGKNLASFRPDLNTDAVHYSYMHNDAGYIEATKLSSGGKFFAAFTADIKEGETYVFSSQSMVNSGQVYLYLDALWGTRANTVGMPSFSTIPRSPSFTATYTGTLVLGLYGTTDIGNTVSITGFQLELGSTATAYEPYTGGEPSPNPDYPQPITPITGDLTITAANGDLSDTVVTPLGTVELCSLPDGTKDSYDAVTGVLTKRIFHTQLAVADMDNSEDFPGWRRVTGLSEMFPDINTYVYGISSTKGAGKYCGVNTLNYPFAEILFLSVKFLGMTQTELKATYPDLVIDFYLKATAPQTIQLTPDLPVVRTGIKTLTVSANITPSFTATVKAMD